MSLILHSGGYQLSRREIAEYKAPEATPSYFPISHAEVAEGVVNRLGDLAYTIVDEKWAINKRGSEFFGLLELEEGDGTYVGLVGVRNSYNKRISLGLTSGLRVTVCDNLLFRGSSLYQHRHTKNMSLEQGLSTVLGDIPQRTRSLIDDLERTKNTILSAEKASYYSVELAKEGLLRSKDIVPLIGEFENPSYVEFKPHVSTLYGWLMALTHTIKPYSQLRKESIYKEVHTLYESTGS